MDVVSLLHDVTHYIAADISDISQLIMELTHQFLQ